MDPCATAPNDHAQAKSTSLLPKPSTLCPDACRIQTGASQEAVVSIHQTETPTSGSHTPLSKHHGA